MTMLTKQLHRYFVVFSYISNKSAAKNLILVTHYGSTSQKIQLAAIS